MKMIRTLQANAGQVVFQMQVYKVYIYLLENIALLRKILKFIVFLDISH